MRVLWLATLFVIGSINISNASCPKKAKPFIPIIKEITERYWSDICPIEIIPGQIYAESSWKIKAERKVGREYGFGLAQITIVKGYFNEWVEMRKRWPGEFDNWKWEDRFNPYFQIKFMVLYDKFLWNKVGFAKTRWDRWAFTLSSYNGGLGGLLKDRRIAKNRGCDPDIWFECVEKYSWRSNWAFKINRRYVKNIMTKFAPRYKDCFKSKPNRGGK